MHNIPFICTKHIQNSNMDLDEVAKKPPKCWDNWCIDMVLRGAENAGDVVKRVGDDRLSRGFGVGIHFKSEACSRNEVIEVLDEAGLIGQANVFSSMAKFRIKLVGDEVKLEGCVELRDDEAFVSGAVQVLGRTVDALIVRMK